MESRSEKPEPSPTSSLDNTATSIAPPNNSSVEEEVGSDYSSVEPRSTKEQSERMLMSKSSGHAGVQKRVSHNSASPTPITLISGDETTSPPPPKGILRQPTEKFPEDPKPICEGDEKKSKERWTKIDRRLVNPEALEEAKERFKERPDFVIVRRVLMREEIQRLADRTREIREVRGNSPFRSSVATSVETTFTGGKGASESLKLPERRKDRTSYASSHASSHSSYASSHSGYASSRSSYASSRSSYVSSSSFPNHPSLVAPFLSSIPHTAMEALHLHKSSRPWRDTENTGDFQRPVSIHKESIAELPAEYYGTQMKAQIIEKLMGAVYDLLGYSSSDDSEGSLSSTTASDTDTGEDTRFGALLDYYPKKKGSVPLAEAAGSSDGKQPQYQGGDPNTQPTGHATEQRLTKPESKRRRENEDQGGEDEDEDDEGSSKRRKDTSPSETRQRGPRFACPFYKRNTKAYAGCKACVMPGFENIARLKQHLDRKHVKHICGRCHVDFESNKALLDHLMEPERCEPRSEPLQQEGLDSDQVERLKPRSRGRIPEEKWRHIYRICHRLPEDAQTPSPYCDHDSLAAQAVESFAVYQFEHLPGLIRRQLEEQLKRNPQLIQLYESMEGNLPEIIRDCQHDIYATYTTSPGNPANWQQPQGLDKSQANTLTPELQSASKSTTRSILRPKAASPLAAFETPPNTDSGMTSSEAQQVSSRPGRQHDLNSDSGYESNKRNPRSDNSEEQSCENSAADSSGDLFQFQDDFFQPATADELAGMDESNLHDLFGSLPIIDEALFTFDVSQL